MNITRQTFVGMTEAEGCFSIYISKTDNQYYPSFRFYLSQKDTEFLVEGLNLLNEYKQQCAKVNKTLINKKLPPLSPGKGVTNIEIIALPILIGVVKPFFQENCLLSSKAVDFNLFFAAIDIYTSNIPQYEKIIYVANFMFAMNTKGEARKNNLAYYEGLVQSKFPSKEQWSSTCAKAKAKVEEVLKQPLPSLTKISPDYFIGLIIGDGCFHVDFDMRQGRKVKVRKALSVSLLKTDRNKEVLNAIIVYFNTQWVKRPASKNRHNFQINKKEVIDSKLQPFFLSNKQKLPAFRQKQLDGWILVDKLDNLLASKNTSLSFKNEILTLVEQIYLNNGGLYRNYSLEEIKVRFCKDYNL